MQRLMAVEDVRVFKDMVKELMLISSFFLNVLFRKYRLVKRETPTIRRTKVKNELRLQRNESLLAVPYLTQVGLKVPSFKSQV